MVKPTTELGYMYGIRRNAVPRERSGPSNAGKFFYGQRGRMAGERLQLDLLQPEELPGPYTKGDRLAKRFQDFSDSLI